MKVNDPNLQGPSGLGSTGASRLTRTNSPSVPTSAPVSGDGTAGDGKDGVELSGLAQALRSLDVDSPERQAKVDALAKAYAQGNYQVDAEAVAKGIIAEGMKDDTLKHS